jgi:hypothetical protein
MEDKKTIVDREATEQTRAMIERYFKKHANVEVTFKKVDGTLRTMPCTLNEALIPPAPAPDLTKPPRVKKFNPDVMSVFCTDKQEWRSFRIENVINVKAID